MQVEVNETNIDKFNLVELTGNSRELMLSRAAEAAEEGHILSCEVPDELVLEQNVFDVYETEHVDPRRLNGCAYEVMEDDQGATYQVCVVHGKISRKDIQSDPYAPCLQVDPDINKEDLEKAKPDIPTTCVYNKLEDSHKGTIYICAVHGRPSKHDISRMPSLPCLSVDS